MPISYYLKKYIIFVVVAIVAFVLIVLWATRPKPDRHFTPKVTLISVEARKLAFENITAKIQTYGVVEPRIKSNVVAQVSGRVVYVSEQFRDGGFFKQGDRLVGIEKADYEIEVEIAKANLANARVALKEQEALADQARRDWERIGGGEQASPLVLREPQLAAAMAAVRSAEAKLRQSQLHLDRCDIRAPFDGRVLSQNIDLGQVVGGNASLAEIYATDAVEIRLPIKNEELPFLFLPESYPNRNNAANENYPVVDIISELASKQMWQGVLVRTSGSIDAASRQLYVVARIDAPFGKKTEGRLPLKIGQYVTAKITGRKIPNAIVIPSSAIYQGTYVYILKDDSVYRREVSMAWQMEDTTLIESGLTEGDILVLTPIGQVHSGTKVKVMNPHDIGVAPKQNFAEIPPEKLELLKREAKSAGMPLNDYIKSKRAARSGDPK